MDNHKETLDSTAEKEENVGCFVMIFDMVYDGEEDDSGQDDGERTDAKPAEDKHVYKPKRNGYNLMTFGKGIISFGRGGGNDIVITSNLVTCDHGYFIVKKGRCYIIDDDSTNGTYVNGRLIPQTNMEALIDKTGLPNAARLKNLIRKHDPDETDKKELAELVEKLDLTGLTELTDGDSIRIDDMEQSKDEGVNMVFSGKNSSAVWLDYLSESDTMTIGRDDKSNIFIKKPKDTRKMKEAAARIEIVRNPAETDAPARYILTTDDENSGILIEKKPLTGKRYELHDRELVVIGNLQFFFSRGVFRYRYDKTGLLLELVGIAVIVRQKLKTKQILDDTSLVIQPGDFVAIVGGSGSGKSTLMECMNGFNKPRPGHVLVNGRDLYEFYDELKDSIGYVPQKDIIHENLSLIGMLRYVAKLRLPENTSREEREARVKEVLAAVELTGHESTRISQLSGGQKKRASIAVELLSDPGLFFLDEPSSGLDPGTERTLMRTLRKLSNQGKTVIMVTHNTNNIHLCDKLIFLGAGGFVAYFGDPALAHSFFGLPDEQDLTDIYSMVEDNPKKWEDKFNESFYNKKEETDPDNIRQLSKKEKKERKKKYRKEHHKSFLHQFNVLTMRYINLIWNDKWRLIFFLLQGPLIAYLFSFVTVENTFQSYFNAQSMLFCLSCAGIWVGLMNSIQEVCKERSILRREYMSDVKLSAYVCSKLAVQTLLAIVQCGLMLTVFALTIGLPEKGVIFDKSIIEMMITLVLVTVSSSSLGLLVSCMVKNTDRAMVFAPIILIPQLLFSGILFTLEGVTEIISWVCVSRWGMEAFSNTANLNGILWNNLSLSYNSEEMLERAYELNRNSLYHHSALNLLETWGVILLTIVVFSFVSMVVLRRVKKDKR